MYRTAPQIVFQFVGGFSITHYAYPILFTSFKSAPSGGSAGQSSSVSFPSIDALTGMFGKSGKGTNKEGFGNPRSPLSHDLEVMLTSYRFLSATVLSLIVVSGGAPALLGAGISIYCEGGPEGLARYQRLKQKIKDFNKS